MARNESLQGAVFAKDAATAIPPSPVVGTTYRDTTLDVAQAGKGWPFRTIVDSSEFNEMMFRVTALLNNMEQRGLLNWSSYTDYSVGSFSRGATSGTLYECIVANGPNIGGTHEPESNPTYWKVATFGSGIVRFVSSNTTAEANDVIYCISGPVTITLPSGAEQGTFVRVATGAGIAEANKVLISGANIDVAGITIVQISTENSFIDFYWDATNNIWRSARGGAGSGGGAGGVGKSIFEIFYSMSSENPPGAMDLSVGTLIPSCDTAFPDFWKSCIQRQTAGTIRCLTEAQWQAEATANGGSCGAFVVDQTAKSVRLPKIVDYLRSGTNAQLGIYLGDAIRNITGYWAGGVQLGWNQIYDGALYDKNDVTVNTDRGDVGNGNRALGFDASRVVPTANENRPKTIYGKLYIQVYTAAIPASVAEAGQFINMLASKANTNMDNVPQVGTNEVLRWGMPDFNNPREVIAGTVYTADVDLFVCRGYTHDFAGSIWVGPNLDLANPAGTIVYGMSAPQADQGRNVLMVWRGLKYAMDPGCSPATAYPLIGSH